ncbi:phage major capsid protein [Actinomyces culturomici]|uniref:phage major capsid protein n=1 Tax=Actinomyces culturomici TaxID=1926276 RepID=UPI000E1FE7B6|nr:phage major capsid protein [Actinomyces culturomici]
MMKTTETSKSFLPDEIGPLVIQPTMAQSVAFQASGVQMFSADNVDAIRLPIVKADPSAAWVAEGEEIPASDQVLAEDVDTFHKVAGLTIVSRELVSDSAPSVADEVGKGLARDISRKIDAAFFGSRADKLVPPRGLGDITGIGTVAAGTAWKNSDPFVEAIYNAENAAAKIRTFVANPADALALAKLKDQTGSERPLLGPDPTQPTRRILAGVPLLSSPAVAAGTVWGIPESHCVFAIREDVTLDRDGSAFFTSDRIAIRATMRIAILYPHPAAIQKITIGA